MSQYEVQKFTPLVKRLITSDSQNQGHIHSCVCGTYNNKILLFNI